jgi:hypothetical protein
MDYAEELLGPRKRTETSGVDYAEMLLSPKQRQVRPASSVPSGPFINTQALAETVEDLPAHIGRAARGVWQGATDLPIGVAQIASKALPQPIEDAVSNYIRQREAEYQERRGTYADRADVGRITGTVVGAIPFGGQAAAATLPGRMAQGAKIGAGISAATPVNPEVEDFWLRKGAQVGIGATVGAIAPLAVEGMVKGVAGAVNKMADLWRSIPARARLQTTQPAVESTLKLELAKNGFFSWEQIPQRIRDALVVETQNALKAGGKLDNKMVERFADFQKLEINPLRGQVSRDPYQFALERNTGKTEAGRDIATRLTEQNERLIQSLDDVRTGVTGGQKVKDAYSAGESVAGALRASDEAQRKGVTRLYEQARATAGMKEPVPQGPLGTKLQEVLDDFGAENIPAAVQSRLRQFGFMGDKPQKPFTFAEAEKLRRLIGNNDPGYTNRSMSTALGHLRDALDDSVAEIAKRGNVAGAETAKLFTEARAAARGRFEKIDSLKALKDMLRDKAIPAEDFVDKYVLRAGTDDIANLMKALPIGSRRDIRAMVTEWIQTKAVSGSGDTATFTQAGFDRALNNIGDRNLRLIFNSPQIVEQLERIRRVASNIQKAPISSGVNYSSSGTAVIDMLSKLGGTPSVKSIIGKPINTYVTATQTARALSPGGMASAPQPMLTMEMIEALSRPAGLVAPAAAAAAVTSRP